MPDKEQKIVFVRLRELETACSTTWRAIKSRAERAGVMRTATTSRRRGRWPRPSSSSIEAEKLGLDVCWVAEAWGADAPSPLGYLAARTDRMLLGSGIMQVGTRTPVPSPRPR